MNRRAFLKNSAVASAAVALGSCMTQTGSPRKELFEISLAEWSLNRALFGKKLDHLDFPLTAKRDYGIDAVEYVNQFWMDKAKDQVFDGIEEAL